MSVGVFFVLFAFFAFSFFSSIFSVQGCNTPVSCRENRQHLLEVSERNTVCKIDLLLFRCFEQVEKREGKEKRGGKRSRLERPEPTRGWYRFCGEPCLTAVSVASGNGEQK